MDRETVEEIKRHLAQTVDALHGRVDKTVDALHGHVDKTVGELHAHFDETVEDMKRHFGTFGEGLRSDMRVIAEGQDIVRQRLGGLEVEVRDLKGVVQRVHSELTGRLNDHERRLTTLERKPAKGR